ncbi:hypothetical protein GCU56_21820 [Geodermatophilus sabuli]|uniref:Uncharacterized protein n=1 Tax=Geodermatophilus sabuli TaxID=1564158 RepID=A0A7K3W6Z8_9ACTN|nr:hypothetical protein [Geodermatophilus sabuli]NEK60500.1 hypothetical protein [Geodermatophilus sabuli]
MRQVLRTMLRSEAGNWRALADAIRRRPPATGGAVALPYAGQDGAAMGVIGGLGLLELVVVHVLVPWPVLRWVLFALGLYGLVWFAGFVVSLRRHPHLLRPGALELRFGHVRSVHVPLAGLVGVRRHVQGGHRRNVELDGDRLAVSFMGETNVELRFDPPVQVEGQPGPVVRVAFSAHDAAAAVRELRARVSAAD